jgi:hypothetical protein
VPTTVPDGQPTYEVVSNVDAANHGSVKPLDELIQASDGQFYGTTAGTGTPGTVFRMDPMPSTIRHRTSGR